MVRSLLLTGLAVAAAAPALAQPMGPTMPSRMEHGDYSAAGTQALGQPSARALAFSRLQAALRDLRRQALALRGADGGTLTPEHRALIQRRLDAAQAAYRPYRQAPW